ncbi:unnamed protein product [Ixodes pacificus]
MNARTWAAATFGSYGCGRRSEAFLLRPVIPTTEPGGDLVFFVTASFAGTKKAPEASPGSRRGEKVLPSKLSDRKLRHGRGSRAGSGAGIGGRFVLDAGPTRGSTGSQVQRPMSGLQRLRERRVGSEMNGSTCPPVEAWTRAASPLFPGQTQAPEGVSKAGLHLGGTLHCGPPVVLLSSEQARAQQRAAPNRATLSGVPAPGSRPERQVRDADPGKLEESNTRHAVLGTQPDRLVTKTWDHGEIMSSESGSSLVESEKGLAKRAIRQAYSKHQEDRADGKKCVLSTQKLLRKSTRWPGEVAQKFA